jgi:hypothetical protein
VGCKTLKKRFANEIFGMNDAHCGWDRKLLVKSVFQHWRIIFYLIFFLWHIQLVQQAATNNKRIIFQVTSI